MCELVEGAEGEREECWDAVGLLAELLSFLLTFSWGLIDINEERSEKDDTYPSQVTTTTSLISDPTAV